MEQNNEKEFRLKSFFWLATATSADKLIDCHNLPKIVILVKNGVPVLCYNKATREVEKESGLKADITLQPGNEVIFDNNPKYELKEFLCNIRCPHFLVYYNIIEQREYIALNCAPHPKRIPLYSMEEADLIMNASGYQPLEIVR